MSEYKIQLGKLELKNPVILASGTFDKNIVNKINVNELGGIVTKTVTLKPRLGNPLPHIIKTKYGFLNSVGLKNQGLKNYLKEELPFWQKFDTLVITSIGGHSEDEFIQLAKYLNAETEALEVNVSCPNIKNGLIFGTDPELLQKLITKIRKIYHKILIVKLTPNVTDITETARATLEGGADVLSLTNTFLGLEIDNQKRKAKLAKIIGGYSGPAIKPLALRCVWQVYKNFKCPIIGGGGIADFNDALDFIMAGASAVSIGSANYLKPDTSTKIVKSFEKYFRKNKIKNINQIKGII